MENITALKEMALGNGSLELREEAGIRMVTECARLKDTEALEVMAKKDSGHMPKVREAAGYKLIDIYTEQRKSSALCSMAEDDNFTVKIMEKAWENAKLCALSIASGVIDLDSLMVKHRDFIRNAPMQKKPKSIPPPRLTPVDKLRARKN